MGLFGSSEERERKNLVASLRDELTRAKAHIQEAQAEIANIHGAENARHAVKWEYWTLDDPTNEQLTELGLNGWEMVGLTSYTVGWGVARNSAMKVHVRHAFKRAIAELASEELRLAHERLDEWIARNNELCDQIRQLDVI